MPKMHRGVANNAAGSDWSPVHNARPEIGGSFAVDKESVCELIAELDETAAAIAAELQDMVGAALATGIVSWRDVGEAVGLTRQGANQRFKGARQHMLVHAEPEVRENALRQIGAKRRPIMYELFDGSAATGFRRQNPGQLLNAAHRLDDPIIVKIYPDGERRYLTVESVEEWNDARARKATKRAAKQATRRDDDDEF